MSDKQLFDVKKVGLFLDAIKHHNETRNSGEVKVITCTVRVEPFDAKLATALDTAVRTTCFKLNHPDPQPHIRRCDFALGHPRQKLSVFASVDTAKPTIALDQVKVSRLYVRASKAKNGFTLVFDLTFGPVSKGELAYVEEWRGGQRAVSFEEAEPSLDFEDEDQDDDEDDDDAGERPGPMFDTDGDGKPTDETPIEAASRQIEAERDAIAAENEAAEPVRQKTRSHYADRGQKKKGGRRAAEKE